MRTRTVLGMLLLSLLAILLYADIAGPPVGVTGIAADGGKDCASCHNSYGAANADTRGRILLEAGTYTPGQVQQIRVTVEHPDANAWGFQLAARPVNDERQQAGTFAPSDSVRVRCGPDGHDGPCGGPVEYASHNATATQINQRQRASWTVDWTPPLGEVGDVTLYAAGVAADNNRRPDGDRVYTTRLRIGWQGACPSSPRAPQTNSVVNGASFQRDAGISANAMLSIFGLGFTLGSVQRTAGPGDYVDGKFPLKFGCLGVEIAGQRVPLTFIKTDQINVQAPANLPPGPVDVRVIMNPGEPNEIRALPAQGIPARTFSPAFFVFSDGHSIAALHADYGLLASPALIAAAKPAQPGEVVLLYGTGFGLTNPLYQAGEIPQGLARLPNFITVTMGGTTLRSDDVIYAGLSPGSISGLYQFNVRVPAGAPDGDLPVTIEIGGYQTQPGATIFVKKQ